MNRIDIFCQSHGFPDIAVAVASPTDSIADVLAKLGHETAAMQILVFLEDLPGPIERDTIVEELLPLTAEEATEAALRIHVSRCRKVEVVVRYNGQDAKRVFAPGATVERVRRWAARRAFGLSPRDAAEHVLQLQGTTIRPDRDTHIGCLVTTGCEVAFDLVPVKRVEG